jgi:ribosomal protein L18E
MNPTKKQKIEAAGGKIITIAEFLNLSPEEEEIIEIRLKKIRKLKQL